MRDSAIHPVTTLVATDAPATSDSITTVRGKRKHAFYVTPDGAAPATTPRYAPLVEPRRVGDELGGAQRYLSRVGLALVVIGVVVSVGLVAVSRALGSSTFLIAAGPIVAGMALLLRGSR